jgi:hypothetical protein
VTIEHGDWNTLVESIRRGRAPKARFFKPVCLIAAIDLANAGSLVSDLLHAEAIVRRFAEYVSRFYPDRASDGWQPLWHISNDGLWTFYKNNKPLGPRSFDPHGKPGTKAKLYRRFDTMSISANYRALWETPSRRSELRDRMLLMLAADNADCRRLVRPLFDSAYLDQPDRWPSEETLNEYLQAVREQPELFDEPLAEEGLQPSDGARSPGEALLAFNSKRLPPPSVVGPQFRATGTGPIGLVRDRSRQIAPEQADFHHALLLTGRELLALIPDGANLLASLRQSVEPFLSALGEEPAATKSHLLWIYGNKLRRACDADLRIRKNPDRDTPPLPEREGELLGDLVDQFNVYAWSDDFLGMLDQARRGPAGRAELLIELEAGRNLTEAIERTPGIMDPAAAEILSAATESAASATESPGINSDQAIANALEMQRNGGRAILRSALFQATKWIKSKSKAARKAFFEGALKHAGSEFAKLVFVNFVNTYRSYLEPLWRNQSGSSAVEYLIELLRKLFH